ncbi:MAG: response regulator transcription factor [Lysobacteraceae bacterium]
MNKQHKRILVIEDDPDIGAMLALNLGAEGFEVAVETSGEGGLRWLQREEPLLLVLDLMLPGIDGLQVCRKVREREEYVPVIILSAKSSETQRVVGLELGADDYLTKPFSTAELIARIHAVLRRMKAAEALAEHRAGVIRHGPISIDPVAREVRLGDREVVLTSKEFDLLAFFARNAGRTYRRAELLDHVWGHSHDGYEHTVNSHINRLRAKIEDDPANPGYILTVWGVGYKFATPGEPVRSGG